VAWELDRFNPIEHLWDQQKRSVYRRFKEYSTLADLGSIVAGGMDGYISMVGEQTMP
jgi:hypothetical protein